MSKEVELGKRYKDSITGFEGIAMARTWFYNGCIRVGLQGPPTPAGEIPDYQWVDISQLGEEVEGPGGPGQTPKRDQAPKAGGQR